LAPDNFAWNLNLGHAYLLQGDRETAHGWYEKTIPLIPDESSLETGPLADFDLFIERGWQVEASQDGAGLGRNRRPADLTENQRTQEQYRLADEAWAQGEELRQAERFLEAAEAYLRSAEVERASGRPRMLDLAAELSQAAVMYQQIARYGEAEPLFREALAISSRPAEGASGHRTSLNNLAELLQNHRSLRRSRAALARGAGDPAAGPA
jgi:tetratricopeptide (TPR) repeat protein